VEGRGQFEWQEEKVLDLRGRSVEKAEA